MIRVKDIEQHLRAYMEEHADKGLFEVGVSVSPKSEIKIYVDSMTGVDIDTCVEISRYIESCLDRDKEDFELTVSSAGLDQPLKVPAQYKKNEGREVKVTLKDGTTVKGLILAADDEGFTLKIATAKKSGKSTRREAKPADGAKAAADGAKAGGVEKAADEAVFSYGEVKETRIVISFK